MAIEISSIHTGTLTIRRSLDKYETHALARQLEKFMLSKGLIATVRVK